MRQREHGGDGWIERKGWKDMGRGMSADNGLRSNVWKEERRRQADRHGYACRSGGMSVDNGLHLMSGGRRGYRDKKEGWRDEWAGGRGMALSSYPYAMLIEHTSMADVCLRLQLCPVYFSSKFEANVFNVALET